VNLTPKLVQNIYSTYNSWLRSLSLTSLDQELQPSSQVTALEPSKNPYERHLEEEEDFDDETSLREEDDESYSRGGGVS
jgi:hypothetical protein